MAETPLDHDDSGSTRSSIANVIRANGPEPGASGGPFPAFPPPPVVCFVTLVLTRYRVPFHERVRAILAADGIDYRLIYGAPVGVARDKADTADLPWATCVQTRRFSVFGRDLFWQPVIGLTRNADLTIASQENKLLANYVLQLRHKAGGARFAFWGHGRNLQSGRPHGFSEQIKRRLATRAHWWFAYTDGTRHFLEGLGYPPERITVFNNAIDIRTQVADMAGISPADCEKFRHQYGIDGDHIGLYVGGMYREKRLEFLIEAARLVHARLPSFRLVLVGGGPDEAIAAKAAASHAFIRYLGPCFGRDKALCASVASVFLLPAAVGLAVLDSFAYGLPMLTIAGLGHGPEIEYLKDGENGVILPGSVGAQDYANVAFRMVTDEKFRGSLVTGARRSAATFSIEAMAENFCSGVRAALARDC